MPNDIQEIYQTAILPLPEKDQLKLASLILAKLTQTDAEPPPRKGDITRFIGMFDTGDPDSADNEKIDADLARAYLEDYERSK